MNEQVFIDLRPEDGTLLRFNESEQEAKTVITQHRHILFVLLKRD